MSNEYELARDNRQDLIFTKEQLLAPLLPGHGAAAAPDAAGRHREGLLPRRADQPGHLGRRRAGAVVGRRAPTDADAAGEAQAAHVSRRSRDSRPRGQPSPPARRWAFWILAPARACSARWAWCRPATRCTRRSGWSLTMLCLGVFYVMQAGAVPRHGADHRLHRRDHDAVPVRADAGRPGRVRLADRDAARPAGRRDPARPRLRRAGRHRPGPRARRHRRSVGLAEANARAATSRASPRCCSPSTCSRSRSPRRC